MRIAAASLIGGALLLALVAPQGSAAESTVTPGDTSYARPSAPVAVTAELVDGGIAVQWQEGPATLPATTHYVVHAGPGSCPVTVPAGERTALLPIVRGPRFIVPKVQAVNAYGYSDDAAVPEPLAVAGVRTPGFAHVQLLHITDFHGAISPSASPTGPIGGPLLAAAMAADRAAVKRTLVLSSGDNAGGSPPISGYFDEIPAVRMLNIMGLDVSTLGNHEHDRPLEHLRRMMRVSKFEWVVSNYSPLAPLRTGPNPAKPYTLITRGGVTIGVVGMNTASTREVVPPGNLVYADGREIRIRAGLAPLQRRIDQVRAAGADIVVALVHEGWNTNADGRAEGPLIDIASRIRGADVVLGGHTHQAYASRVGSASVSQVPNSGQMYSRTQLCIDRGARRLAGASIDFVTKPMVAGLTPDPRASALVTKYSDRLQEQLGARVGTVSGIFPRGGSPAVERSGETPLGNYAADVIRGEYATDFALINGGGIRDTLPSTGFVPTDPTLRRPPSAPPYDIVAGDVYAVFPFGNNVATTRITGERLWLALENGVGGDYGNEGRFPQISGFTFTFDPTRPAGSRILDVRHVDGRPIPPDATTYSIATLDFIVYGGDGYGVAFTPVGSQIREPFVDFIISALAEDLAAGRVTPVPAPDGRITRVG